MKSFQELKYEFEYFDKISMPSLLKEKSSNVKKNEVATNPYYDLPIYSYQRNGFSQGRIVKHPRSMKNKYEYSFDYLDRISIVKIWNELNSFNVQLFYYEDENRYPLKSIYYLYSNILSNITYYEYKEDKIVSSISVGKYGCKKEVYLYEKNSNKLLFIKTQQFDLELKFLNELMQKFIYNLDGMLIEIKNIYDGEEDTIYYLKSKP